MRYFMWTPREGRRSALGSEAVLSTALGRALAEAARADGGAAIAAREIASRFCAWKSQTEVPELTGMPFFFLFFCFLSVTCNALPKTAKPGFRNLGLEARKTRVGGAEWLFVQWGSGRRYLEMTASLEGPWLVTFAYRDTRYKSHQPSA